MYFFFVQSCRVSRFSATSFIHHFMTVSEDFYRIFRLFLFPDDAPSNFLSLTSCFLLSSPLLARVVLFIVLCVVCIDPAMMRKSPSVDSSVGKSGRLTVKSVCTNWAWCCVCKSTFQSLPAEFLLCTRTHSHF